jgi:hypothetical protein
MSGNRRFGYLLPEQMPCGPAPGPEGNERRRRRKAANLLARGRQLSLFALLVVGCQRGATAQDAARPASSTEAQADGNVPFLTEDSGGWRLPRRLSTRARATQGIKPGSTSQPR